MIVASVVVGTYLVLVLRAVVENHIGGECEEDVPEKIQGKAKGCPIMTILEDLESISVEINTSSKVQLEKDLQRDLVSSVPPRPVTLALETQVVFDRSTGELDFIIESRAELGEEGPDSNENRQGCKDGEEVSREAQFPREPVRHAKKCTPKNNVGELLVAGAVGRQRGVLDRG